jgi:hypothetical protein
VQNPKDLRAYDLGKNPAKHGVYSEVQILKKLDTRGGREKKSGSKLLYSKQRFTQGQYMSIFLTCQWWFAFRRGDLTPQGGQD